MEIENIPIEELITEDDSINYSLQTMKAYRHWTDSTISSYVKDVNIFEEYMYSQNLEPTLKNVKLYIIQKWINDQLSKEVAHGTIKRRLASLSSVFGFYKDLGIIIGNPFKASDIPEGIMNHHSPVMTMEQLKQVYRYLKDMNLEGSDIEVTIKVMLFTGLRNNALTQLKVKDVVLNEEVLHYDAGIINSKHKVQFFPLPPKLLKLLDVYIIKLNLQPNDSLLYGIKGQPLKNKQLNRITNKICKGLGWG